MERVVERRAKGLGGKGLEMPVLPNPPWPLVVGDMTDVVEISG